MTKQPTTDLLDANGVPFSAVRTMLPERVSEWTPRHPIRLGGLAWAILATEMHVECGNNSPRSFCWLCGITLKDSINRHGADGLFQIHHGPLNGAARRSDERCCLWMLCPTCHRDRVGPTWVPRLLWTKWKHDHEFTDWVRAIIVAGRWLDAPEPPPAGCEFWLPGIEKMRARA